MADLDYKLIEIGPELAEQFLNSDGKNRRLNSLAVRTYAGAMTRGEWMENGVPVLLDGSGHMLDGQHRMAAIIESGTTQTMLVVAGLDPVVQTTIDIGRPRRLSDALTMQGESNVHVLAAAIKRAWSYERDGTWTASARRPKPTHRELLAWYAKHPQIKDNVQWAAVARDHISITPSTLAALRFVTALRARGHGERFWRDVAEAGKDGQVFEQLPADDPVRQLVSQARRYQAEDDQVRVDRYAAIAIKAFNVYLGSGKVSWLGWGKGESFPAIGPDQTEGAA